MSCFDRHAGTSQLLNRLRMKQVALILAVAEKETLRGAASELSITQPAATKMLHELESALGQTLFDRVGRGIRLNTAGERVTAYFRSIRGNMEAMNRELSALKHCGKGRLSIGSIMAASPGPLTEALIDLKATLPLLDIDISVDTSDRLLPRLEAGMLEVVIGRLVSLPASDYSFRVIDNEELALVVGPQHPLARRRLVAFDELLAYQWVLQPVGSPMRDVIDHEFHDHGAMIPSGLVETGSILTTVSLIRRAPLIAVVPKTVAQRNGEGRVLRVLPYRLRRKLETYGSVTLRGRPLSKPAEQFLGLLHRDTA